MHHAGRIRVRMDDGSEEEFGPGDTGHQDTMRGLLEINHF
jgi:hypothetical protein